MRSISCLGAAAAILLPLLLGACGGGGGEPADTLAPVTLAAPPAGTYQGAQSVSLTCDDGGGSGCMGTFYTTDGSAPTQSSTLYAGPIAIAEDTTLRYFSVDNAGNEEAARSASYVIEPVVQDTTPPVTTAAPAGGTYAAAQSVVLTCDDGAGSGCAATYYTLDGTIPTAASPVYAAPLEIAADTQLRFFSVDQAGNQEAVKSEAYAIDAVEDTTPPVTTATPAGGTFAEAQTVALACDDGAGSGCAATYFTVDGSVPTTASAVYASPLQIAADTTLRFFSVDSQGNQEAVQSEVYVIDADADITPPVTAASPAGGTYGEALEVRLTCDDGTGSGCAGTYYTLDGSEPNVTSAIYAAPIPIAADTTLRFFSQDYEGNQEGTRTEVYLIDAGDLTPPVTTASPAGGVFTTPQTVTLTCDDGAGSGCQITYYTVDGSQPTPASPVYTAPLDISVSTTLRFFSQDMEGNQEEVRREVYEIQLPSAMQAEWLGAYGATGSWQTGDGCTPGSGDGMLRAPTDVLPAGGHLYIVDSENKRVVKVEAASGAFVGWIGRIGQPPTGGAAGCAGAVSGEVTPGWCTGGTGAYGDQPGAFSSPSRLATHAGVLFVSDTGTGRLNRFEMDSGAYLGAIEGPQGPTALAVDGVYLYAAEDRGQRISRWLLADGSAQGWTGRA
ncbi:MAG TPA: chitobiase/beta-hexosaminidase C-terminal domain-containing protein [Myxococcota bacterium]|nr:chitobiase/beta-hexosaminidase C-terminal domain-containing protein [Myxococcota bacterium]HRY97381.1 chitobiase/beta-hexosaminidase C-terminal domain-containing protein [Myxococcota bacterium]HSA21504.1 chitobiase/beta-hexosaminidase C-terminal domain-containing protein [Myxococcota bacterium]